MKTPAILTILAIGYFFGSLTGISAKEINERPFLDPGAHARANAVIAGGLRLRTSNEKEEEEEEEEEVTNDCD
jgi:hypothetical protein